MLLISSFSPVRMEAAIKSADPKRWDNYLRRRGLDDEPAAHPDASGARGDREEDRRSVDAMSDHVEAGVEFFGQDDASVSEPKQEEEGTGVSNEPGPSDFPGSDRIHRLCFHHGRHRG